MGYEDTLLYIAIAMVTLGHSGTIYCAISGAKQRGREDGYLATRGGGVFLMEIGCIKVI